MLEPYPWAAIRGSLLQRIAQLLAASDCKVLEKSTKYPADVATWQDYRTALWVIQDSLNAGTDPTTISLPTLPVFHSTVEVPR